ncbi:hypothetical protein RB195_025883 [Necator americanus]|uniref:Uncharacterized protein n=1 Tax=Necator americanus TaxID=51031 RepID=A0ABR1EUC9_NECAM
MATRPILAEIAFSNFIAEARPGEARKTQRTFSVRAPIKKQEIRTVVTESTSANILLADSSGQDCTDIEIV